MQNAAAKNRTVFMIEDDPLVAQMYQEVLESRGFEISVAFDGEEAIAKLEGMDKPPDLILLDIMLPKLNGYEVLKYLKEGRFKSIPVVAFTNLPAPEDAKKAYELGAKLYLVKVNNTPTDIADKIEELIMANGQENN